MTDERPTWAARLQIEREARVWNKHEMARALLRAAGVEYPPVKSLVRQIRMWEAGQHYPRDWASAYAAAFGIPEAELFGERCKVSLWHAPSDARNGALNPDDEVRLLLAARRPSRADHAVVKSLAVILDAQRRTEDVIGSAAMLGPVKAQLDAVQDLVIDARGTVRPAVVNVAAQWAQFYGWLAANSGDLAGGRAWLDRALEWAVEADDINLISEVLSFKGHVAWMDDQIGPMIGLSAAARRGDGLYPGQYAISAAQEARGYAMAGEAYDTDLLLDEADEYAAAARERPCEAPPWLYYHSPGFFELQRGHAYRYLGVREPAYNAKAVSALTAGLALLPADMRGSEWAGEFVYQLGRAHLQDGDLDQAAARADELDALGTRLTAAQRLTAQAQHLR